MTLLAWLKRYGTTVYAQMRRKQFTAAQKQQIARELLNGRLSEDETLLKYELRLKKTLRQWVVTYGASESGRLTAEPDPPADTGTLLATQLRQAQWQNAERRHSELGYQSPNHFEIQLQTASQLCPA